MQAARDLLFRNSVAADHNAARGCGPLPKDARLIAALMYLDDDALVHVETLALAVNELPAGLLRFAYCVPEPPNKRDVPGVVRWRFGFTKDTYNSEMRILIPTPCAPVSAVLAGAKGPICSHSSTGMITHIRPDVND